MTITSNPVDNGVNTEALLGARDALSKAPDAAEFTWRATCSWIGGTYSRSTVEGFARWRTHGGPSAGTRSGC